MKELQVAEPCHAPHLTDSTPRRTKWSRSLRVMAVGALASGLALWGCAPADGNDGNGPGSGNGANPGAGASNSGSGGNTTTGTGGGPGAGGNVNNGGNVGTGGGGSDDYVPGSEWILYDGESGALTVERTGIKTDASIHAVATADHTESASVSLSIPIAGLINDISKSKGVKFNIRGTGTILFQAQSTHVIPISAGGSCNPDATSCWNAHEKDIALSPSSTPQTVLWNDLTQSWGTDTNTVVLYGSEILLLSWIIPKETAGEFWLDGIEFIPDDSTPNPGTGVAALLNEAQFNAIVTNNGTYTYQGFLKAAARFPAFAGDHDEAWAKRELAMFLANAKHETGSFVYVKEISPGTYCKWDYYAGCPAGENAYYGRGSMQLSWNYNYDEAGKYLGIDLLNNPNQIETSEELLWDTGIWYWMYGGYPSSPHSAFKSGLGATIQRINGIECNGGNANAVNLRQQYYGTALTALSVDAAGTNTGC